SISAIISGLVADAKNLLISELTLTKLELQREITKAKAVAIMIAVGVGFGFIGAIALVFMLVHILETFTLVPLWGCFGIVGGALVLFGALAVMSGKIKSKNVTLLPRSPGEMRKDLIP
ncbi:MAG TPA: phage holin family protein, partial [Candidatus Saccharimonadales bacterium]|nr:phage holin family protein [Candidatus Saccharimonadales bacterium]